jgi:hypothetical protein
MTCRDEMAQRDDDTGDDGRKMAHGEGEGGRRKAKQMHEAEGHESGDNFGGGLLRVGEGLEDGGRVGKMGFEKLG